MNRRQFLSVAAGAVTATRMHSQTRKPNIVFIYADDLGYGDLGCYGGPLPTPNIDQMAAEGARLTHFYSSSPVCSPSRAALLTGRYPTRVDVPLVLGPDEPRGLPESETTLAQLLKKAGYRTACVGKWHLGSNPGFLPTDRGFDEYFGIPYSHDMWPPKLLRGSETVVEIADPAQLTRSFTREAISFIDRAQGQPFFLYLAHTAPHLPLAPSAAFAGKSGFGPYGDVVQELDTSVGEVLASLKTRGLDSETIVLFSSDNGPWWQGSQGRLRGRKGETYEGGMRVPLIARRPGVIPEGLVSPALSSTLDILPTIVRIADAERPPNRIDGIDILPILSGEREDIEREVFLYFDGVYLQCARMGRWKLHLARYNTRAWSPMPRGGRRNLPLPKPELYDILADPQESYDCSSVNPGIVAEIRARVERLVVTFPPGIVDAWRTTMGTHVQESPADGLPVADEP